MPPCEMAYEMLPRASAGGVREIKPMSHWIPGDKEAHAIHSGLKRQKI